MFDRLRAAIRRGFHEDPEEHAKTETPGHSSDVLDDADMPPDPDPDPE